MSRAPLRWLGAVAVLGFTAAFGAGPSPAQSSARNTLPAWLTPAPHTIARVDVARWVTADEPESALTQSVASAGRDFSADSGRPADVVYQPIGVRVRLVRVLRGGRAALVAGIGTRWQAYAPLERLVPEVPPGTALTAAGGFGGFAELFADRGAPEPVPVHIVTGTRLTALRTGVAPYDAAIPDLVRVRVRVASGALRGRTGWIAVAYTGIPVRHVAADAGVAAKTCSCRLVSFTTDQR